MHTILYLQLHQPGTRPVKIAEKNSKVVKCSKNVVSCSKIEVIYSRYFDVETTENTLAVKLNAVNCCCRLQYHCSKLL